MRIYPIDQITSICDSRSADNMFSRTISLGLLPKQWNTALKRYHNMKIPPQIKRYNLNLLDHIHIKKYSQEKTIKCWQCGVERKNISELFCEQCNYIQSPQDSNNYFKIFELNEQFDIDQKELTQKYRKMQSVLHPDKFSNKSSEEKNISEEFSSLVNKAYNILQTPLKRATHLLFLKGGAMDEDQRVDDPAFLMEIMELNEEVENANTPEKLINLKKKNDSELGNISNKIKTAFDTNQIEDAKNLIIKMKYYNSVSLHINHLMREKGIVE